LGYQPVPFEHLKQRPKETDDVSAVAKVSHGAVVKMLLMRMAIRPNALLSLSAIGIKKIWMSLELSLTRLAQPLLMGVMIGPGEKLNSGLLVTLQHIAAVINRERTKNGFHDARPRFDAIILYRLIRNFHQLHNSCRNGLICILGWMASSIGIGVLIQ
jgi:hypothetical protein